MAAEDDFVLLNTKAPSLDSDGFFRRPTTTEQAGTFNYRTRTPALTTEKPPPVPNPDEVAVLIVDGFRFQDWESVWVQHRWGEPFAFFQFTTAEREPYPNRWQALRFYPNDRVLIELGGKLAMNGIITVRQVAYDKKSHAVQLQGKTITWWAAKSSVETQTGSFDGQSFEQIARAVLAPYPSGVKTIGELDPTPFKRCSNQPGETCWDFLERLARPRGIVLGSDHLGNVLLIDDHPMDRLHRQARTRGRGPAHVFIGVGIDDQGEHGGGVGESAALVAAQVRPHGAAFNINVMSSFGVACRGLDHAFDVADHVPAWDQVFGQFGSASPGGTTPGGCHRQLAHEPESNLSEGGLLCRKGL